MKLKAILFDLDGTLLPMDQDQFVTAYFTKLAQKLSAYGYQPKELIHTVWAGTHAMIQNDGSKTNEQAFWAEYTKVYGNNVDRDIAIFTEFYGNEFCQAKAVCGYNPEAPKTIHTLREMGYRVALATNPVFPSIATETRMGWAGLSPKDFELFTTYENSHYCKPNPAYFAEILEKMGLSPEECLMVGNDVDDDGGAQALGMRLFLLTDCLINLKNADISAIPHGSFADFMQYIQEQS